MKKYGKRLIEYGENKLEDKKKESLIVRFLKQFISAAIAKMEGSNDYMDSIIIIAIVVFNAIMGLVQEAKAEKSLEALKKMSAPTAKVRRGGKVVQISSSRNCSRRYCYIRGWQLCSSRL